MPDTFDDLAARKPIYRGLSGLLAIVWPWGAIRRLRGDLARAHHAADLWADAYHRLRAERDSLRLAELGEPAGPIVVPGGLMTGAVNYRGWWISHPVGREEWQAIPRHLGSTGIALAFFGPSSSNVMLQVDEHLLEVDEAEAIRSGRLI